MCFCVRFVGVDELRRKAQLLASSPTSPCKPSSSSSSSGSNSPKPSSAPATNSSSRGAYTDEQERGARRILAVSKRCHYEVLGLSKGASSAEIKKSYRKMALKYHPDKNNAPSADDAFKAVNAAFQVLNDATKREQYDQYGHEAAERASQQGGDPGGFGGGGFPGGFGAHHYRGGQVSPEDLFNMFFQGGPGGGARVFHTNFGGAPRARRGGNENAQQNQGAGEEKDFFQKIFQFLPIIMLLLMTFGGMGDSTPEKVNYSLYEKHPYVIRRTTKTHGVVPDIPYFVNDKFATRTTKYELPRVEKVIEKEYREKLQYKCQVQREKKNSEVYKVSEVDVHMLWAF